MYYYYSAYNISQYAEARKNAKYHELSAAVALRGSQSVPTTTPLNCSGFILLLWCSMYPIITLPTVCSYQYYTFSAASCVMDKWPEEKTVGLCEELYTYTEQKGLNCPERVHRRMLQGGCTLQFQFV